MSDPFDEFESSCARAFSFLCERFGFRPPQIERLGRESYVQFHKGSRTVSIAWEPGGPPIVELFLPSKDTDVPPTPWAERDGAPYTRLFPRSAVPAGPRGSARKAQRVERRRWNNPTAATFDADLSARAERLARDEGDFLSG